jgi:hypothetical protein
VGYSPYSYGCLNASFFLLLCRESAATLEAESGYTMEAPEVTQFRRYILGASWSDAEDSLTRLGVTEADGLWVRPCYAPWFEVLLSSLSGGKVLHWPAKVSRASRSWKDYRGITSTAKRACTSQCRSRPTTFSIRVRLSGRNHFNLIGLPQFRSLMMCSDPADLRQRADWDGASGTSRRELLTALHRKFLVFC